MNTVAVEKERMIKRPAIALAVFLLMAMLPGASAQAGVVGGCPGVCDGSCGPSDQAGSADCNGQCESTDFNGLNPRL